MKGARHVLAAAAALLGAALLSGLANPPPGPAPAPASLPAEAASALLGPARGLVAGFLWVDVQRDWERRDAVATAAGALRVVALVPGHDWYRVQAARLLAYDLPRWDGPGGRWVEVAVGLVDEGIRRDPARARFHLEAALLELGPRGDLAAAAARYRDAALCPDAPPFAARLHGSLLERLGRRGEAAAWYRSLLAGGPGAGRLDPVARDELAARLGRLEGADASAGPGAPGGAR